MEEKKIYISTSSRQRNLLYNTRARVNKKILRRSCGRIRIRIRRRRNTININMCYIQSVYREFS